MSEETVTFNLELNVENAIEHSRRLETVLYRGLGLWQRIMRLLGLPADSPINQAVERIQKLVMMIRLLHSSAIALQAASGPIGWAMAGIGVGTFIVSGVEMAQMELGSSQA